MMNMSTNLPAEDLADGPTVTTKALLVTVLAPRKIYLKKVADDEWVGGGGGNGENENEDEIQVEVTLEDGDAASTSTMATATSISVFRPSENQTSLEETLYTRKDSDDSNETKETKTASSSDSSEEEEPITAAEAAAIKTVGTDLDEEEVNVEELLRIAIQSLLNERHVLNVPTFSEVLVKQEVITKITAQTLFSDQATRIKEVTSWIRMDLMTRPASLGIILERLERIGIGHQVGTISIYQAELCKTASPYAHLPVQSEGESDEEEEKINKKTDEEMEAEEAEKKEPDRLIEEAKMEWKNAATRLRIEQIKEQIVEQATFSFDFVALLTVASILAGIGLITNNTVVIVASMLVSPIMGPVLGLTFGSRIGDWGLVRLSFKNESIALLGCIIIGAFIGLIAGGTPLATETWPTSEMQSRGEWVGLFTGIAVAIPSGMGVCLSILGGNTSSLVGVAISASLLPPAVNAGICLIYSLMLAGDKVDSDSGYNGAKFTEIGVVSFALTAINIICIWVSGLIMFEIKEVSPTRQKNAFWSKDLKEARKLNKEENTRPINLETIRKGLRAAMKKAKKQKRKTVDDESKVEPPQPEPPQSLVGETLVFRPTAPPVTRPLWSPGETYGFASQRAPLENSFALRSNNGVQTTRFLDEVVWKSLRGIFEDGEEEEHNDDVSQLCPSTGNMRSLLGADEEGRVRPSLAKNRGKSMYRL